MEQQQQQQRGFCSFTPARAAGCGAAGCGAAVSTGQPSMRLSVTSTTGSPVELTVPRGETVEGLRTRISQKLRLQTDRIVLLHKDRQLTAGKLLELGVADGSKLTLVPVIEAGLVCSTARAERTTMDVLESLTEVQISDFLSGRSPLTINLGIGAHMMYVQLQLSAQDVAKLQQDRDPRTRISSKLAATDSTTSPASQTSSSSPATDLPESTFPVRHSPKRPASVPAVNCHHHLSPLRPPCPTHTSATILSSSSSPSCSPHPSCPRPATTPICVPGPSPGPPSPVPASAFEESNVNSSSTPDLRKQPGAVIESFVSHSPGVFSGTFSGTLAPCSQSGISHPRRGVAIILQILNDLLRAACHHQGAPPAQPQPRPQPRPQPQPQPFCPVSNPPVSSLLTAEEPRKTTKPVVTLRTEHPTEDSHPAPSSTEENQTLHCKLEQLQFLMHQRRLRRRTRRNSHLSPASHPYQHLHHRP